MRVILDTNVYVSMAIGSAALAPLRKVWEAGRISTIISGYLVTEIEDVLSRPKLEPFIDSETVERFLELVVRLGQPMVPAIPHPDFADPKDRYLLAMLRDSDAESLVTGDKVLLALGDYGDKSILSPLEFLARLDG